MVGLHNQAFYLRILAPGWVGESRRTQLFFISGIPMVDNFGKGKEC
jgi:hypothetical protein